MKRSKNQSRIKGLLSWGIVGFITIGMLEISLRITSKKEGNSVQLLGKRWYYLAPVGIPETMPSIETEAGAYRTYDPDVGWSIRPLGRESQTLKEIGEVELYYSNEFGYRCGKAAHEEAKARVEREGVPASDETAYRFVCIGDSFTHGDAVFYEESWPSYLQEFTGSAAANLGVGGYGIDQAVLRYEKKKPSGRNVLLGLIAGDLERATQLIYNFCAGGFKSKPVFVFDGEETEVANRPALYGDALKEEYRKGDASAFFPLAVHSWDPRLLRRDVFDFSYCYRMARSIGIWRTDRNRRSIYGEPGHRLDYCINILRRLKEIAATQDAKVTIVLLGNGNTFPEKAPGKDNWKLMKSRLDQAGIPWIDTTPDVYAMWQKDVDSVINSGDGLHYTPEANKKVAEIVARGFELAR